MWVYFICYLISAGALVYSAPLTQGMNVQAAGGWCLIGAATNLSAFTFFSKLYHAKFLPLAAMGVMDATIFPTLCAIVGVMILHESISPAKAFWLLVAVGAVIKAGFTD